MGDTGEARQGARVRAWRRRLDERIAELERFVTRSLAASVVAGLSLRRCTLLHRPDRIPMNGLVRATCWGTSATTDRRGG